ncbi:MAG: Crp/Fnr family transcriptional regulator [Bacteroidetes bacterium]|nr:Crp/Fnr family transcriptional regulator [Bacteroidota bacterium]MCH7772153.1 Crp/Fnr family transcriptional regulator [Bacteroidota bacterium]
MEKLKFLSSVPIFSDLNSSTLQKVSDLGSVKFYPKNSVIFSEEEDGTALFVIISGKVKVCRTSKEDTSKEVIFSILNPSDFFGEMALLDGLNRSANVIAMEDSQLFLIQRSDFLELLHNYPEVSIALLQELTQRLRASSMKVKALSLKDAEGKVATVLLQLADDVGKIKHGIVEIDKLPFQHELANMAGTSRETISRTLHSFAKKGLVELEGSKLRIINYEKFKDYFS